VRGALLISLLMAACGESPGDKILGWPPRESVVAVREVVEAPEVVEVPDVVALDVADVEVALPPPGPCTRLVDVACELWTTFADSCREARRDTPDESHGPTAEQCQVLVDRYVKDELPRMGNPCGRLSRAICKDSGETSERCRSAKARVPLLTKRHQWRACLGDLLWFEARTFRR
jgi:hypothetical protein